MYTDTISSTGVPCAIELIISALGTDKDISFNLGFSLSKVLNTDSNVISGTSFFNAISAKSFNCSFVTPVGNL